MAHSSHAGLQVLAARILEKELELSQPPTAAAVCELVDLYRTAIECAELTANHQQLQRRLHEFLARPDVLAALQPPRGHRKRSSYDEHAHPRLHRIAVASHFGESELSAVTLRKADRLLSSVTTNSKAFAQQAKHDIGSQEATLKAKLANRRALSRSMGEQAFAQSYEQLVEALLEQCFEEQAAHLTEVRVKYQSQLQELCQDDGLTSLVASKVKEKMHQELAAVEAEMDLKRKAKLLALRQAFDINTS